VLSSRKGIRWRAIGRRSGRSDTSAATAGSTLTTSAPVGAKAFAKAIDTGVSRGQWVSPRAPSITFDQWAAEWRSTVIHLRPKTLAGYDSLLKTHLSPTFGSRSLARIQPADVRAWVPSLHSVGSESIAHPAGGDAVVGDPASRRYR
jgi:hypothetical protein